MKKVISFSIAIGITLMTLIYSFVFLVVFADNTVKITLSIELFTIGNGYIIEPVNLEVDKNTNVAKIIINTLHSNGYLCFYSGSEDEGFYLAYISSGNKGIRNFDGYINSNKGKSLENYKILDISPSIPKCINEHLDEFEISEYANNGFIGEFDFTSESGWMYCVNNEFPSISMSEYSVKDGDVIRLQFTLSLGRDIGDSYILSGEEPYYNTANKDDLTRLVAEANNLDSNIKIDSAYKNAIDVLQSVDAAQSSVDSAYNILNDAVKSFKVESDIKSKNESKVLSNSIVSNTSKNREESTASNIVSSENESNLNDFSSDIESNGDDNTSSEILSSITSSDIQESKVFSNLENSNINNNKSDMVSDNVSNIQYDDNNKSSKIEFYVIIIFIILLFIAIVGFIIYKIIQIKECNK